MWARPRKLPHRFLDSAVGLASNDIIHPDPVKSNREGEANLNKGRDISRPCSLAYVGLRDGIEQGTFEGGVEFLRLRVRSVL